MGFGMSYLVHLLAVFMLVMGPVVAVATGGAPLQGDLAAGGGKKHARPAHSPEDHHKTVQWELTWVHAPMHVSGWQKRPEGKLPHLVPPRKVKPRLPMARTVKGGLHRSTSTRPLPTDAGEGGSYAQYLSAQVRRGHHDLHYFRHASPSSWAVVRYRIAADGQLLSVNVLRYSGSEEDARRAGEVIELSAPFDPLPRGAKELEVTELFWNTAAARFQPGTLEWYLSRMPDGRFVHATY